MRFFILLLMTLPLFSCVEVNVDDLNEFVVTDDIKFVLSGAEEEVKAIGT